MSTTPAPQQEGKQKATGMRLLAIGAALIVVGIVLLLLLSSDSGTTQGIGVAFLLLGALPAIVGLVLVASSFISGRSRKGKPFA